MKKHSINIERIKRKSLISLRPVKAQSEMVILGAAFAEERPKAEGRFHRVSQSGNKDGAIFPLIARILKAGLIELMSYDASPLYSVVFGCSVCALKSVRYAVKSLNYTISKVRAMRRNGAFHPSNDLKSESKP